MAKSDNINPSLRLRQWIAAIRWRVFAARNVTAGDHRPLPRRFNSLTCVLVARSRRVFERSRGHAPKKRRSLTRDVRPFTTGQMPPAMPMHLQRAIKQTFRRSDAGLRHGLLMFVPVNPCQYLACQNSPVVPRSPENQRWQASVRSAQGSVHGGALCNELRACSTGDAAMYSCNTSLAPFARQHRAAPRVHRATSARTCVLQRSCPCRSSCGSGRKSFSRKPLCANISGG